MPAPTRAHSQLGLFSPRTLTIVVVLFGLMAIPIWWSKRSKAPATAGVKITPPVGKSTATPTPAAPSADSAVASPDRLGLSLGHGKFTHPSDVARFLYAACDGEPKDSGSGSASGGMCNAQVGDASCRAALPILCIQKDSSTAQAAGLTITPAATRPATTSTNSVTTTVAGSPTESTTASVTDTAVAAAQAAAAEKEAAEQQLQASWAGGQLGATAPVAGFVLPSVAAANARCEAELGSGWRMASMGDASSGKGLVGKRGPGFGKFESRLWVHSEGKKAHCWDPS